MSSPESRSPTSAPPLKKIRVGLPETPSFAARSRLPCRKIFRNRALPANCSATASNLGARASQGGHSVEKKSSTTGSPACRTSFSYSAWLISFTCSLMFFLLGMDGSASGRSGAGTWVRVAGGGWGEGSSRSPPPGGSVVAARHEPGRLGTALRRLLGGAARLLHLRQQLHHFLLVQAFDCFFSLSCRARAASQSSHGASGFFWCVLHVARQFSSDCTMIRRSFVESSMFT